MIGNECRINLISFLFWANTKFYRWPKIPNPVTSVAPFDLYFCIILEPILFNLLIDVHAISKAWSISSSDITDFTKSRFSFFPSDFHWNKLTATWVPIGFVNKILSPTYALLGIMISFELHITLATPPIIGHGFMTDCPPVT